MYFPQVTHLLDWVQIMNVDFSTEKHFQKHFSQYPLLEFPEPMQSTNPCKVRTHAKYEPMQSTPFYCSLGEIVILFEHE